MIFTSKKSLLADQRVAADIVTEVLLELQRLTKPDVSLDMLDEMAERMIRERDGTPYNKGYKPEWAAEPFPATVCMSVDYEICHAPPGGRFLKEGSIINYDLGVKYKSGCGDAALTVAVGKIDNRKERAIYYALQTLYEGIKVIRAGIPISDIGFAIQRFANTRGYKVIKEFGGHHIGREMHEKPFIRHIFDSEYSNIFLEEGAVICLEPLITPGKGNVAIDPRNKWSAYVTDGQPVAMFEHQILVLKDGYEILTKHLTPP